MKLNFDITKYLTSPKLLFGGVILVATTWTAYLYFVLYARAKLGDLGLFGDAFGALNCLFTGIALAGVVAGFWHEREEAEKRAAESAKEIETIKVEAARAEAARARENEQRDKERAEDMRIRNIEQAATLRRMEAQIEASIYATRVHAVTSRLDFLRQQHASLSGRAILSDTQIESRKDMWTEIQLLEKRHKEFIEYIPHFGFDFPHEQPRPPQG